MPAQADYKDDVNYTQLESELGAGIPDGAGVSVSQIEASTTVGSDQAWMPDPDNAEFSGKTIADISGSIPGIYSGHATGIGRNFFGTTTSTSPGISNIASYLADHWIGGGFLRLSTGGWPVYQPLSSASRVSNHSWVGNAGSYNTDALARLDWAIDRDEMVQAVGFNGSTSSALLATAYNVIAVNRTEGPTDGGSASGGGIYTAGRTKPDIVAPATNTSSATPRVASAAALLIDAANNNPSWSMDPADTSTTNRNGDTIYNAERLEVIKAALMAGADRETSNSTSADISDYRVDLADQTANGLDRRFGAGQLNINNSYHIIAAGEHNSEEDLPGSAGLIGTTGFDYDPAFGGSNGSNTTATYYFAPTSGPAELTASLVWNIAINGGSANNFNGSATLYDLDLLLFDVTDRSNWIFVRGSTSTTENTENIWQLLDGGKDYALRVIPGAGQSSFKWDFALAWQVTPATPATPLVIDPITLPDGLATAAYSTQILTASNGQTPYTWSITSGSLPTGLSLSVDGVINGTPTTTGTASFTVQATDATSATATLDLQITVKNNGGYNGPCSGCHSTTRF